MSKQITITIDRKANAAKVQVPVPEGGVLKAEDRKDASGKVISVMPFDKATPEQKAYHVFWSQGTKERIDELASPDPMQARATLIWLVRLRCMDAEIKTGFKYDDIKVVETWGEQKR